MVFGLGNRNGSWEEFQMKMDCHLAALVVEIYIESGTYHLTTRGFLTISHTNKCDFTIT